MKNSSILFGVVLLILLEVSSVSFGASVVDHSDSQTTTLKPNSATAKSTPKPTTSANDTCVNGTACKKEDNGYIAHFLDQVTRNKDMLLRTMYVLIGVTGIVIVYFVVRAWRLRSRRRKARKYGIITTPASDLEMAPLGQGDDDDDDEDMTVFEVNGKRMK